jgi:hypothetical protein
VYRKGIDSRIRTGANRYASADVDEIAGTATAEFDAKALREDQFDPGLEPVPGVAET